MTRPLPHVAARAALHEEEEDPSGFSASVRAPSHVDPEWGHAYVAMLRESLCLFANDVLGVEMGPHLFAWEKLIQKHRKVAINAARDHSKSTFFSYCYPIWRAWSEPGCEVYIFSKTQEQAIEFLDIIIYGRNNLRGLVDIPELAHLVPQDRKLGSKTKLKKTDVRLTNGSRFRTVGYGKAIRGAHPKYIVLDDPLNDEDMWSETTRQKNIEYFKSAIINMVTPDGQCVVVGTPFHISDLYGWFRENPKWVFRRFPGILTDKKTGEQRPLFPWRWSLEALLDKKEEVGSVSFAREILCEPITDDIAIFPSYLWPPCYDKNLTLRPSRAELDARGLSVFMGVDIARSASVGADFFVIFVVGRDSMGNRYLIDIKRPATATGKSKGLSFNEQLDLIERTHRQYVADLVFIESNAMQQVWSDELRRTTDVPIKEFVTLATNKYPLDKGVPSLRILLENRKLILPYGDEYSRTVVNAFVKEAQQFGYIDGKLQGIGAHDDQVMAWWFAEEAAKRGGFSFSMGDEEDDGMMDELMGGDADWEAEMLGDDADFKDANSMGL